MVKITSEYRNKLRPKIGASYSSVDDSIRADEGLRPLITSVEPPVLNGNPLENGIALYRASGQSLLGFIGEVDRSNPDHKALLKYLRDVVKGFDPKQKKAVSRYLGLNGSRSLKAIASETGQSETYLEQLGYQGAAELEDMIRNLPKAN